MTTWKIEEVVNGRVVASSPVGFHPLDITVRVGQAVGLDVVTGLGRLPHFNPENPLNWNHTNRAESLAWDSAAGSATYTAHRNGYDSLAVTFEIGNRFHTGYVTVDVVG